MREHRRSASGSWQSLRRWCCKTLIPATLTLSAVGCRSGESQDRAPTRTPLDIPIHPVTTAAAITRVFRLNQGTASVSPIQPQVQVLSGDRFVVSFVEERLERVEGGQRRRTVALRVSSFDSHDSSEIALAQIPLKGGVGSEPQLLLSRPNAQTCVVSGRTGKGLLLGRIGVDGKELRFLELQADDLGSGVASIGSPHLALTSSAIAIAANVYGPDVRLATARIRLEDTWDVASLKRGIEWQADGVVVTDFCGSPDSELTAWAGYAYGRSSGPSCVFQISDSSSEVKWREDDFDRDMPLRPYVAVGPGMNPMPAPESAGGPLVNIFSGGIACLWVGADPDGRESLVFRYCDRTSHAWSTPTIVDSLGPGRIGFPMMATCAKKCVLIAWLAEVHGEFCVRIVHMTATETGAVASRTCETPPFSLGTTPGWRFGLDVDGNRFYVVWIARNGDIPDIHVAQGMIDPD